MRLASKDLEEWPTSEILASDINYKHGRIITPDSETWRIALSEANHPVCKHAEYGFMYCQPAKLQEIINKELRIHLYSEDEEIGHVFSIREEVHLLQKLWREQTAIVLEPTWLRGIICQETPKGWTTERLFDPRHLSFNPSSKKRDFGLESDFFRKYVQNLASLPVIYTADLAANSVNLDW